MGYTKGLGQILTLGRASNLPTVWTNCLAVTALAGSLETRPSLGWVCIVLSGCLLYLAGCTWNDAFDVQWDAKFRPERPIPSGEISLQKVILIGVVEVVLAVALSAVAAFPSLLPHILLTLAAILLYDWLHKQTPWAVLLMVACRICWALTVWKWATMQTTSLPVIAGLLGYLTSLASAILLISLVARKEAKGETNAGFVLTVLPWVSIATALAGWASVYGYRLLNISPGWEQITSGALFLIGWLLWMLRAKAHLTQRGKAGIGEFVSRSLAGICLLDTAFATAASPLGLLALAGLPLALMLQKKYPAT